MTSGVYIRTKETREKMSESFKGRIYSKEHNLKISLAKKGKNLGKRNPFSKEHCKHLSEALKGRIISPETRQKLSVALKGKNVGKIRSEEFKRKDSLGHIGKKHTKEHNRKIGLAQKGRKHSEEHIRKIKTTMENPVLREKKLRNILKSLIKRPTSYEQKIIDLCQKYSLPFDYVGDGKVIINYVNPDFINNNGKKQLIEVYHRYFKERNGRTYLDYEKERSERFARFGFKTLFLRDEDVCSKDWEKNCLIKVRTFTEAINNE